MNTPSFDRYFSVGQLADLLSLSTRSARRLLPEIGFVRVGRAVRIPQSYLENYLQSRSVPPLKGSSRRRALVDGEVSFLADRVIGKHRRRGFRK
jgi:excisionase family DNA binding protein